MTDKPNSLDMSLIRNAAIGHATQVTLLLGHGADPEYLNSLALTLSAANGHLECVKILAPLSDPLADNSEALRQAAENGRVECVEFLIPISEAAADGSAALCSAAQNGHAECVNALIPKAAARNASDALCLAASEGYVECVALLLPISACIAYTINAFYLAAGNGHARVAELILAGEPHLFGSLDFNNLLDSAVARGHHNLAALFSSIIDKAALRSTVPEIQETTSSSAPSPRL